MFTSMFTHFHLDWKKIIYSFQKNKSIKLALNNYLSNIRITLKIPPYVPALLAPDPWQLSKM